MLLERELLVALSMQRRERNGGTLRWPRSRRSSASGRTSPSCNSWRTSGREDGCSRRQVMQSCGAWASDVKQRAR
eukprot:2483608-Lingulodinium_polyedra.AAC.1